MELANVSVSSLAPAIAVAFDSLENIKMLMHEIRKRNLDFNEN